jgi:hypothetical protein
VKRSGISIRSFPTGCAEITNNNLFSKGLAIDESIFKLLFNERMGAPNSPASTLEGIMIVKDALGWSDLQLLFLKIFR